MPSKFASGKYAIAECDRCGQRYKLKELQKQVLKTRRMHLLLCLSVRNSSSKSAKSQISKVIGMQCS